MLIGFVHGFIVLVQQKACLVRMLYCLCAKCSGCHWLDGSLFLSYHKFRLVSLLQYPNCCLVLLLLLDVQYSSIHAIQ
jgi:hypothetical protein